MYNNSRVYIVSFASNRFINALAKVKTESQNFPFDKGFFYSPDNESVKPFISSLKPWLYRRGFGYWRWKAYILLQQFSQIKEGDIIFWSDAGVYWNNSDRAIERFNYYLELLNTHTDILVFQQPLKESDWTKGDLLEALGVYENEAICNSPQIWAGCFGLRKTSKTENLLKEWLELGDYQKELITDRVSYRRKDKQGFIEHRYDQSIFSILVKLNDHIELPPEEVYAKDCKWETMQDFPIQARRNKNENMSLASRIINKMLRPWRIILYYYFTKIRHYKFANSCYPW